MAGHRAGCACHHAPHLQKTAVEEGLPLQQWRGRALVVGCGGIGSALVKALEQHAPGLERLATRRCPTAGGDLPARLLHLDLNSDRSLSELRAALAEGLPLRLVINTAGLLQGEGITPEKRLARVNRAALHTSFAVNAFAPLLLAQALEPLFPRDLPCHFASLSARVGSIGDNRSGGWYAYRAAKAAQNQLLRTLAVEWRRRLPQLCVSLLHPGTTATPLSQPFQAGVPAGQLFSPERSAQQLLQVLGGLGPERSGGFWAWDGQPIPW
jgi:NAD(P)-dependent dehydrogenase (short-subunit alcohol dehydrogenase family)